jgi:hypothetical protein
MMSNFTHLIGTVFIIFNAAHAATLPFSTEKEALLTPRSQARHWIDAHQDGKKLTPRQIPKIKRIYERLFGAFNSASGNLDVERMVECSELYHEVREISKINPIGNFQVLEESLLHFTLWRVFRRTPHNKINEALSLWHLQQQLFRRYNPMHKGLIPITPEDMLKIFKAAFVDALQSGSIDEAFKLWQQQQKFIIDARALIENPEYISSLDMHAAFSAALERETEPYKIVHVYELWQSLIKEFSVMLPASIKPLNTFKDKYNAAKQPVQLPEWIVSPLALSIDSNQSLSTLEHSWRDSPKNKIAAWVDSLILTQKYK